MNTNRIVVQYIYIYLLVFMSMILGCKGEPGPVGPSGSSLIGDIEGYAGLIHEYGVVYSNHLGITVSLEGTNNSTETDSTGWWRLTGVKSGTYTIVFQKTGYFTQKIYGVQFVGGGVFYLTQIYDTPILYELPAFSIKSIKYEHTQYYLTISGEITSSTRYGRYVFVLFDSVRTIAKNNFMGWTNIYVQSDSTNFSWSLENYYLPFKSGQWIYIRSYPGNWGSNSGFDPITRKRITTNVGDPSTPLDSIYIP